MEPQPTVPSRRRRDAQGVRLLAQVPPSCQLEVPSGQVVLFQVTPDRLAPARSQPWKDSIRPDVGAALRRGLCSLRGTR
jgi:hypothetical protein